ncbi:hypothetical protein B0H17DRAFT_589775 [Mycena rosella]|uniref:C2H2-type domain-containing protein n=1 Tax=Mycena rosella TaxID=1033263 RepID=A0AAD7BJ84_MYCRO|nr:hypothetical protein B0H17DRAFT_589775 [Mycena rosella]
MSLVYPAVAPAYANLNIPTPDTAHPEYLASYPNAGQLQLPRAFAVGSSLGADHLEHPRRPPRYFHARGTQLGAPSTSAPRYSGTSSSAAATRYATGVPISGYGATAAYSSPPAGRTWGLDAPASANDAQGLAVHGHASEGLLPLRYSAAAAASRSAPSPVMAPSSTGSGSSNGIYKGGEGLVLASPTPQVPLPAQMAILLNTGGGPHREDDSYGDNAQPTALNNLRMPISYAVLFPNISEPLTEGELEGDPDTIEEGFLREKKHGCTMCHKRFDRPSTLKKHLLVHTGEKAFQCAICERRFGVMSNLNRHIRRCSLREVHTHGSAAASSVAATSPERLALVATGKRGRTPPPSQPDGEPAPAPTPRKRRRRPPSPSRWIPPSLRSFNLLIAELTPPAPIPLPPVSPSRGRPVYTRRDSDNGSDGGLPWDEERDSWDENVGRAPYHPREWDKTHRLPGPRVVTFGGAVGGNYSGDSDPGYACVRGRAVRV